MDETFYEKRETPKMVTQRTRIFILAQIRIPEHKLFFRVWRCWNIDKKHEIQFGWGLLFLPWQGRKTLNWNYYYYFLQNNQSAKDAS